jgi:hypothetical protein
MDTNGDAYRIGDAEWDHGLRSDVVYEPMHVSLDQPPIIVEVQATVNADFMNRAAHYCIMAYCRYKVLPILLIFNTQTTSISTNDRSSLNNFCALSLSCEYWAKKCYLVNANSASSENNNELHPFTALSVFFDKATNIFIGKQFVEGSRNSITISNSQGFSGTVYQTRNRALGYDNKCM